MNHASLLETTAEVSVAFMGFVGIFLILSSREQRFAGDEALMIKALVILSVTPVFSAPMPLVLNALGFAEMYAWRASSGALGFIGAAATIYMVRDTIRVHQDGTTYTFRFRDLAFTIFGFVYFLSVLGNLGLWNWLPTGGVYLVTVWSCLGMAAIAFVHLIFSRVL